MGTVTATITGKNFKANVSGDPMDVGMLIGYVAGQAGLNEAAPEKMEIAASLSSPESVIDPPAKEELKPDKPHKGKTRKPLKNAWSAEDIKTLLDEKAKGTPHEKIAKMLGRSSGCIAVKISNLHKLGKALSGPMGGVESRARFTRTKPAKSKAGKGEKPAAHSGAKGNSPWADEKVNRFRVESKHKTIPELCRMFECSEKEVKRRLIELRDGD